MKPIDRLRVPQAGEKVQVSGRTLRASARHGARTSRGRAASPPPDLVDGRPFVLQKIEPVESRPPRRVAVVLDPSRAMAPYLEAVADGLRHADARIDWRLFVAGEGSVEMHQPQREAERADPGAFLAARVNACDAGGGRDGLAALKQAREFARDRRDAILWMHAGQPALFAGTERDPSTVSVFRFTFRNETRVVEYQAGGGRNIVLEEVDARLPVESVGATDSPRRDLGALLERWRPGAVVQGAERVRMGALPQLPDAVAASAALARLESKDRVEEWPRGTGDTYTAGLERAMAQRLVTRACGAVVLETDVEYDLHGLERPPASPALTRAPALPEPEEIALLCVLALILVGFVARELLRRRHHTVRA